MFLSFAFVKAIRSRVSLKIVLNSSNCMQTIFWWRRIVSDQMNKVFCELFIFSFSFKNEIRIASFWYSIISIAFTAAPGAVLPSRRRPISIRVALSVPHFMIRSGWSFAMIMGCSIHFSMSAQSDNEYPDWSFISFCLFFASASPSVFACFFSVLLVCLYLFFPCRPSILLFLLKYFLSNNCP